MLTSGCCTTTHVESSRVLSEVVLKVVCVGDGLAVTIVMGKVRNKGRGGGAALLFDAGILLIDRDRS